MNWVLMKRVETAKAEIDKKRGILFGLLLTKQNSSNVKFFKRYFRVLK
jgi:hypothetical protein